MSWVVAIGGLCEGIEDIIGPFDTEEEAEHYVDSHNFNGMDHLTFELSPPKNKPHLLSNKKE